MLKGVIDDNYRKVETQEEEVESELTFKTIKGIYSHVKKSDKTFKVLKAKAKWTEICESKKNTSEREL